jgi:hypothetical protein
MMTNNIITKDENLKSTPVYIGYMILKILKKSGEDKISIFEVTEKLKKEIKVVHYNQFLLALIFLYAIGTINFTDPYIYRI